MGGTLSGVRNLHIDLTAEEYSFITNMVKQCNSNGRCHFSERGVLRTLIRLLEYLTIDPSNIETEDQLLQRLEDALRVRQEQTQI